MKLKKILSGILATATALVCMPATKSYAYATEWVEGDWAYRVPNTYIPEGSSFDELDVEVIKYLGNDANVVVPEKVGKHKVIGVSGDGRYDLLDDIYNGGAFADRTDIISVTIPEGVEYIDRMAFWDCASLTSVTIPSTVNEISFNGMFYYDKNVFRGCSSLTSINVDERNEIYCSVDGLLLSKDKTTLLVYPYGRKEATYRISDGIVSIGTAAFYDCKNIDTIIIPPSVKYLPLTFGGYNGTFDPNYFSSFENIIVEDDNKFFCSVDGVLFNKENDDDYYYGYWIDHTCLLSYPDRKKDDTYVIPGNVDVIFPNAFNGCDYLTSLVIPSTVGAYLDEDVNFNALTSLIVFSTTTSANSSFLFNHKDITIYGISGSDLEKTAKEDNVTFIPLSILEDNNTDISVTGNLPESVVLKVEKTSSKETYIGYNITITDSEGKEIQPSNVVEAALPVPENFNSEDCKVYRKEADGTYTDMKAVYSDGYMIFTTDHFSEYFLSTEPISDDEDTENTTSSTENTTPADSENSENSSSEPVNSDSDNNENTSSPSDQPINTDPGNENSNSNAEDPDKNVNTGFGLCFVPALIATVGSVIAKKRK